MRATDEQFLSLLRPEQGKLATDKGYTFTVDSILADAARTEVYFTVDGPNLATPMRFPNIKPTYNFGRPGDGWHGGHEIVDGRLVGHMSLPPFRHPVTLVGLTMDEVAGVKGRWSVSFMASRTELDKMTRTIPVGASWKTDDYDLKVESILMAPTQTIVNVTGTVPAGFEPIQAELLADGRPIPGGSASFQTSENGPISIQYRYEFDRVDGDPAALTFRITDLIRWVPGGPIIDLTEPGSGTTYDDTWFEFQSVQVEDNRTTISLRTNWATNGKRARPYREWVVVNKNSGPIRSDAWTITPDSPGSEYATLTVTFPGEITNAVRLDAQEHAEPVPVPFEATIPLR